jgi:cathepsin A (carboxypeptidase C)
MRIAASTVLLGAASAASFQQQAQHVLSDGFGRAEEAMKPVSDAFAESIARPIESSQPKDLPKDFFQGITAEAKALWDEIKLLVPEKAFEHSTWFSKPKPHRRRSDWDHVVKGADVQKLWVQDADGQSHRQVDGRIEDFNLRVKAVDPSKLGVDSVKQYSGYLDDEANDKHLFYCKCYCWLAGENGFADLSIQGSLNLGTTRRTTRSSCGSMAARVVHP